MRFGQLLCPNCQQPLFVLTISRAGKICPSCGKNIGVDESIISAAAFFGVLCVAPVSFLVHTLWPEISGWLNFALVIGLVLIAAIIFFPRYVRLRQVDKVDVTKQLIVNRKRAVVMLRWMLKMMIIIGIGALALWQVFSRLHLLDLE